MRERFLRLRGSRCPPGSDSALRIPEAGEAKCSPRQEEEKEAGGGRREGDEGFQHPAASPAALPRPPLVAFQSHAGGREPSQLRSGTRGCCFEAVETTRRRNCRSGLGRLRPAGASLPLPEPRCVSDAAALPPSLFSPHRRVSIQVFGGRWKPTAPHNRTCPFLFLFPSNCYFLYFFFLAGALKTASL